MKNKSGERNNAARIRSRLERALDLSGRLALTAGIVVMTFFCVQTFRQLGYDPKSKGSASSNLSQNEPGSVVNLLDGDWQFAGLPWSIQVIELTGNQRSQTLSEVSPPTSLPNNRPTDEYDETIWGMISLFQPVRVDTALFASYFIEAQGWQIHCFASLEQPQQIQIIQAQFVSGDDVLKRVDLAREIDFPRRDESSSAGYLLPPGADGKRLALRRDSGGTVNAELFETAESDESLIRTWTEQGWKVSNASSEQGLPLAANSPPSPSNSIAGGLMEETMICNRGKDSVCVVLSPFSVSGTRTLLVLRLSS